VAVYAYKAFDLEQAAHSGTVAADSPKTAREQLRAQGLAVIESFEEVRDTKRPEWLLARSRKAYQLDVVTFGRELSTMLAVGVPMLQALDTVIKQTRGRFKRAVIVLRDEVMAGSPLSEAMQRQPGVFDELSVTLVEVGEASGQLDTVLEELVNFREKSMQFKDRVGTALLYPIIVSTVGIAVAVFLMTFVVPQLIDGLTQAGKPLPGITIAVKSVSDLLVHQWGWLLAGTFGLLAAWTAWITHPKGRRLWHRVLMHVPLVGELIRKQAVVQVAIVMATLLRSGLPFVRALQVARKSARNAVIDDALHACEKAITAGGDIGQALDNSRAFTPTVVQVFTVGQESGQLETMLERLARDYDRQVQTATNRLTALLEPAMIVVLAVGIGIIAFATILPILEAGNVL